jgi:hypothetical protein
MSVVEETLELFGSACWVVALLIAVRALPRAVAVGRATRDVTPATSPASP